MVGLKGINPAVEFSNISSCEIYEGSNNKGPLEPKEYFSLRGAESYPFGHSGRADADSSWLL